MPEAVLIQAMAVMPAADKALSLRGVDHLVLVTILADDPGEFSWIWPPAGTTGLSRVSVLEMSFVVLRSTRTSGK